MAQYQSEDRSKLRKHWVDLAISLAMQSRWDEAVSANRNIIDLFPNDVDAYNRLGRAYTELGRYKEARQAYQRAVEIDPNNAIAQKNLAKLGNVTVEEIPVRTTEKIDPHLFIAEMGKTGVANLVRPAPREKLATMAVGDQVYLRPEGRALLVQNSRGEYLGQVEARVSQRLIDLMKGGNRYAAALVSLEDSSVRLIIREVFQDPGQAGKVSFPVKVAEAPGIRPYIKETLLKYELEEEELPEEELEFETEGEFESEESTEETEFEPEEQLAD
ncbi:MAG: tetratricopeptide repeat protein [Chloroflexi bacterium]|nr:tetratricopeptide repeat protein [Chloroflexota bacterium]MDA8187646.1 tetratricopeptide repeat protein [Dehalococcoidales bacterium]